jgi:hypothetical protein
MPESIPILVASCDAYADLWRPFFTIFFRKWVDCPFPLYLGTNHLLYDDPRVTIVDIGDDTTWTSGVASMLKRIGSEHVILFLEDFFLEERVDTSRIQRSVDVVRVEGLACLRLVAHMPLAVRPVCAAPGYSDLGIIEPDTPYRVSAQVAIWRTESLLRLLVPGANPWEFELLASKLSARLCEPFWGVMETAIRYDQVVEKGRWKPKGLRAAAEAGLAPNGIRPFFSEAELEARNAALTAKEPQALRKAALARHFRDGHRASGLREALRALRNQPASIRLWVSIVAGMLGPRALCAVEGWIFERRLEAIRRRVKEK